MSLIQGQALLSQDVTKAYVSQEAWIQNLTLRENILFVRNVMDSAFYNVVLESCCLNEDIERMSAKDLSEIGENGINLSGIIVNRIGLFIIITIIYYCYYCCCYYY